MRPALSLALRLKMSLYISLVRCCLWQMAHLWPIQTLLRTELLRGHLLLLLLHILHLMQNVANLVHVTHGATVRRGVQLSAHDVIVRHGMANHGMRLLCRRHVPAAGLRKVDRRLMLAKIACVRP